MRQSMTAFARATEETARWRISVEMKSVNHRFLEIQVKMGDTLRHLEGVIRERLQAVVARGKVEIWLFVETLGDNNAQRLDATALASWRDKLAAADPQGALGQPTWRDVLALPGVLVKEYNSEDALDAAVLRLFDTALADFLAMREREGAAIAAVLGARLDSMSAVLDGVVAELPQLQAKTAAILQERLRALQYEADPAVAGQALSQILCNRTAPSAAASISSCKNSTAKPTPSAPKRATTRKARHRSNSKFSSNKCGNKCRTSSDARRHNHPFHPHKNRRKHHGKSRSYWSGIRRRHSRLRNDAKRHVQRNRAD